MGVGTVVCVSVGVSWGDKVAVSVGGSVGANVAEGVSGKGVSLGVNVAVTNTNGVADGRTRGRIVGISPIHAARMTPNAPMIATIMSATVFFSFILNS
jgi:hypothetical protein